MPEVLEAVTAVEEVAAAGEAVVSVDLATVSQQLEVVCTFQAAQLWSQVALIGCFVGVVLALLISRWWR